MRCERVLTFTAVQSSQTQYSSEQRTMTMRGVLLLFVVLFILDSVHGYGMRGRGRRPCGRYGEMCRSVRRCVHRSKKCDGNNDCLDWSDEDTCPGFQCPTGKFHCGDGPCIRASWRCDDYDDCDDGSDERNCPNQPHK